eukprot:SAG31_NODE_860_length_11431_cov_8.068920_3_plen_224_part_00
MVDQAGHRGCRGILNRDHLFWVDAVNGDTFSISALHLSIKVPYFSNSGHKKRESNFLPSSGVPTTLSLCGNGSRGRRGDGVSQWVIECSQARLIAVCLELVDTAGFAKLLDLGVHAFAGAWGRAHAAAVPPVPLALPAQPTAREISCLVQPERSVLRGICTAVYQPPAPFKRGSLQCRGARVVVRQLLGCNGCPVAAVPVLRRGTFAVACSTVKVASASRHGS